MRWAAPAESFASSRTPAFRKTPTEETSPKVSLEATRTPFGSVVTTTGAWFHAIGSAKTCETPRLKPAGRLALKRRPSAPRAADGAASIATRGRWVGPLKAEG